MKIIKDHWVFLVMALFVVLFLIVMNTMKNERRPIFVGGSCGTVSPNSRCMCCSNKPNDAWCKSNPCKMTEQFKIQKKQNKKSAGGKKSAKKFTGGKKPMGGKGGKMALGGAAMASTAAAAATMATIAKPTIDQNAVTDTGVAGGVVMTPAQIVAALKDSINITADMRPQDNTPDPVYDSLGDGPTPDDIALSYGTEAADDQVVYDEAMADDMVPEIADVVPDEAIDDSADNELEFREIDDKYFNV
jgi:hypothetical protein